ncbi:MAG: hypothetical protein A4E52_01810 [Pelotomaculum sp. PtaB.Bin013]|nr:MAG: hypothetical protein A4E52_01810 [Pelotomaculum sp. PtaB.Bin013]
MNLLRITMLSRTLRGYKIRTKISILFLDVNSFPGVEIDHIKNSKNKKPLPFIATVKKLDIISRLKQF